MKKVLILAALAMIAYSCASTKTSTKPAAKAPVDITLGTWDYVVSNTPEGDVTGTLVLAKAGDVYSGTLNGAQGSTPLENITVTDNNLKCFFNYMGYNVEITGLFEGDAFTGKCSVEYNDFPMTMTRKKE